MKKRQFDSLVIHDLEEKVFHLPTHSHTYYEVVYIISGHGIHIHNNVEMSYKPGDLFLISPTDVHHFHFTITSRMLFIKFTEQYFGREHLPFHELGLRDHPDNIMRQRQLKEYKLDFIAKEKKVLKNITETIIAYDQTEGVANSPLIYYQLLSMFAIIESTAARMGLNAKNRIPNQEDIITYLHQNIYKPKKIRIKNLALHFNISEKYFSSYFKRNFEIPLRDYISNYRIALIEKRVEAGHDTLKQIAYEFGFNDESHLSHYYKRKKSQPIGHLKKKL